MALISADEPANKSADVWAKLGMANPHYIAIGVTANISTGVTASRSAIVPANLSAKISTEAHDLAAFPCYLIVGGTSHTHPRSSA